VSNSIQRLSGRFYFTVAIAAVDGLIATGFKGYFGFPAAFGTGGGKHLALGPVSAVSVASASVTVPVTFRLPGLAARGAALGLVGVASGRIELLLAGAESERSSTIGALDGLVLKTHRMTPLFFSWLELGSSGSVKYDLI